MRGVVARPLALAGGCTVRRHCIGSVRLSSTSFAWVGMLGIAVFRLEGAARAPGLGVLLALATSVGALAQPVAPPEAVVADPSGPAGGVIAYPVTFFANFRPTSAFDMVGRVPGFTYAAGDSVRGFAGAAGNVLIDGERPSSKAVTLDEALKRIPPDSVERLELIRGGAPGIDMQGQPVVVNVVRNTRTSSAYAIDGYSRVIKGRSPSATLRIEGTRRTPNTTLEGAINTQVQPGQLESGRGISTRHNGAGVLLTRGQTISRGAQTHYQFNGAGEYRREDDTFRTTLGYTYRGSDRGDTLNLTSPAGVRSVEKYGNVMLTRTSEVGADYARRISPAVTARLIGLYTFQIYDLLQTQSGRGAPQATEKDTTSGEAILRGSISIQHPTGITLETGGETAFNYLDSAIAQRIGGVNIPLPSANVRVEERRSEGFVTASLKPTSRLSLESGVRIETSTIGQTGDVDLEKTFTFVKPRFIAAYALRPSTQLRFRLERVLGQLQFEDFAASSDTSTGFVIAGNANLEPERTWLTEFTFEQRFWGRGAFVATYTHRAIEQVVDVIPIFAPNGVFSAPGNIGDATRNDLKVTITLPLDTLGVKGGQLRLNSTLIDSKVTDPVTLRTRPISLVRTMDTVLTYTQDVPAWNSTFTLDSGNLGYIDRTWRISELQTVSDTAIGTFTWLYRPRPDLIFALAVENLWSRERSRRRVIYSGTRASGVIAAYDYRSTEQPPWVSVRLRKSF
jgi:outer membrane receptor protein involved in Fe transport